MQPMAAISVSLFSDELFDDSHIQTGEEEKNTKHFDLITKLEGVTVPLVMVSGCLVTFYTENIEGMNCESPHCLETLDAATVSKIPFVISPYQHPLGCSQLILLFTKNSNKNKLKNNFWDVPVNNLTL